MEEVRAYMALNPEATREGLESEILKAEECTRCRKLGVELTETVGDGMDAKSKRKYLREFGFMT